MFRRYGGMAVLNGMDLTEAVDFLEFASEQEETDRLFFRWAVNPLMDIPFDEYKAALLSRAKPKKPEKDIIADSESILRAFDAERGL
jgi:hypothetical protein